MLPKSEPLLLWLFAMPSEHRYVSVNHLGERLSLTSPPWKQPLFLETEIENITLQDKQINYQIHFVVPKLNPNINICNYLKSMMMNRHYTLILSLRPKLRFILTCLIAYARKKYNIEMSVGKTNESCVVDKAKVIYFLKSIPYFR